MLYKIVILGDSYVGKTSLLQKYFENDKFTHRSVVSTISVNFYIKNITDTKLYFYDISLIQTSLSLLSYSDAFVIVFDVSNRNSFENIKDYLSCINKYYNKTNIPILIVGNKIDEKREVSFEEAYSFCSDLNLLYHETSVIKNIGIENCFSMLYVLLKKKNENSIILSQDNDKKTNCY
jgi:small GTP-binding protein